MTWKWKIIIVVILILLVSALAFVIKQQRDTIAKLQYAEQSMVQMRQLQDEIARSQSTYATRKDVEQVIKESGVDLKPIKDDLDKLGAKIQAGHQILVVTQGQAGSNIGSTSQTTRPDVPGSTDVVCPDGNTIQCPNPDQFGYFAKTQHLKLDEPFGTKKVPIGQTSFSAWREKPWDYVILPRKYKVTNVISTNSEGRHFVHSKFFVEVNGETYPIVIADSKLVETLPESTFRFSPRLYMGVDGGAIANPPLHAELLPNLQLAIFSYGKTRTDPDWTFLGVGFGYEVVEKGIALMVSPVNYNVAHHLPFVDNVHVGPSFSLDFAGNFGILLGIRVGL